MIHVNMTHRAGQELHCKQPKNRPNVKDLGSFLLICVPNCVQGVMNMPKRTDIKHIHHISPTVNP